jgi:hypothetical protein
MPYREGLEGLERRFLALSEALSAMPDLAERKCAIERELAEVRRALEAAGQEVRFALASRGVVLPVRYRAAVVPDTFRDRSDTPVHVVVEGKLLEDGDFLATDLLATSPMGYFLEDHGSRRSQPEPSEPPERL